MTAVFEPYNDDGMTQGWLQKGQHSSQLTTPVSVCTIMQQALLVLSNNSNLNKASWAPFFVRRVGTKGTQGNYTNNTSSQIGSTSEEQQQCVSSIFASHLVPPFVPDLPLFRSQCGWPRRV